MTAYLRPAALRRAAQRARMASARRRRPSGVMPPLRFALEVLVAAELWLAVPRRAQRARAAAASLARVAADMGRRRLSVLAALVLGLLLPPPPPNNELSRRSKVSI